MILSLSSFSLAIFSSLSFSERISICCFNLLSSASLSSNSCLILFLLSLSILSSSCCSILILSASLTASL
jgi:hypothetical protein